MTHWYSFQQKKGCYFDLEPGRTILEGTPGEWDANGVHTLSILEADRDGWKYWGYYCGGEYFYSFGVGLARSNDLLHWIKLPIIQPLVGTDSAGYGGRWPSMASRGGVFYMLVTKDFKTDSYIALYTSRDGIHFNYVREIIRSEKGLRNQNPNLFFDDKRKEWILYYYRGDDSCLFQIRARVSREITSLDQGKDVLVLEDKDDEVLASPSMFQWKGRYYLLTETTLKNKDDWRTRAWASKKPLGGFVELEDSPLPEDIHACAFQHWLNHHLVITYSYQRRAEPAWEWDLRLTKAVLED